MLHIWINNKMVASFREWPIKFDQKYCAFLPLKPSLSEAKTILRNNFRTEWRQRLDIGTKEDSIHQLDRAAQVTIFRLRIGHYQLLSHLHRLKISHSDECLCGIGPQPPTTSCSPAPLSTLWDARHGPVWWMPTGSFGDRLRYCSRLRTSPYSPDWKSSMVRNTEEETFLLLCRVTRACAVFCTLFAIHMTQQRSSHR